MRAEMIQRKRTAVPPKLFAGGSQKINLIVDNAWLEQLDAWRKRQDGPISTRSDAIRKIVEQVTRAPNVEASGKKKPKG